MYDYRVSFTDPLDALLEHIFADYHAEAAELFGCLGQIHESYAPGAEDYATVLARGQGIRYLRMESESRHLICKIRRTRTIDKSAASNYQTSSEPYLDRVVWD